MEGAIRRGIQWLLSMQNRDGGWGAFDRDNDRGFLCNIPFADHNAMIDPSTADVTARVVECLGRFGWPAEHPAIQRAVKFLLKDQSEDGSWFGRWGVNYIYGSSGVLRALETVSLSTRDYCHAPSLGFAPCRSPTAASANRCAAMTSRSRRARARAPLRNRVGPHRPSRWHRRQRLRGHQSRFLSRPSAAEDGSWSEPDFTGTGFPGVFYLKYHLYRNSFPVYALARYSNQSRRAEDYAALKFQPSEFRLRSGF